MARKHVRAAILAAALLPVATATHAGGVFLDVPMTRVFTCEGGAARMEIYLPQSLLRKRDVRKLGLGGTLNGLYALDQGNAENVKVIEPVRLRSTKDNAAIVIEQFTQKGRKPVTIPVAGGTLDLDQRVRESVTCAPFSAPLDAPR